MKAEGSRYQERDKKKVESQKATEKEEIASTEPTEGGNTISTKEIPGTPMGKKMLKDLHKQNTGDWAIKAGQQTPGKGDKKAESQRATEKEETTGTETQEGGNTIYTKDPRHPHGGKLTDTIVEFKLNN